MADPEPSPKYTGEWWTWALAQPNSQELQARALAEMGGAYHELRQLKAHMAQQPAATSSASDASGDFARRLSQALTQMPAFDHTKDSASRWVTRVESVAALFQLDRDRLAIFLLDGEHQLLDVTVRAIIRLKLCELSGVASFGSLPSAVTWERFKSALRGAELGVMLTDHEVFSHLHGLRGAAQKDGVVGACTKFDQAYLHFSPEFMTELNAAPTVLNAIKLSTALGMFPGSMHDKLLMSSTGARITTFEGLWTKLTHSHRSVQAELDALKHARAVPVVSGSAPAASPTKRPSEAPASAPASRPTKRAASAAASPAPAMAPVAAPAARPPRATLPADGAVPNALTHPREQGWKVDFGLSSAEFNKRRNQQKCLICGEARHPMPADGRTDTDVCPQKVSAFRSGRIKYYQYQKN